MTPEEEWLESCVGWEVISGAPSTLQTSTVGGSQVLDCQGSAPGAEVGFVFVANITGIYRVTMTPFSEMGPDALYLLNGCC